VKKLLPKKVREPAQNVSGLYRAFAHLAADWVWELDADLCYVFHDGRKVSVTGVAGADLVGRNRIDVLDEKFIPSDALSEHHQLLRSHENIDLIIRVSHDSPIQYVNIIAQAQFDDDGEFTGYRGCGRDVSKRMALEEKLAHLATHDDLTGVINRREFERKLGELHRNVHLGDQQYSLCFIDLDRFKHVNDTGGHHAGDQLLRELVGVIRKHVHPEETLARLGGDEFGLLLKSDSRTTSDVAEKIIDEISRYEFNWEEKTYRVGASIGIVEINKESETIDSLMVKADNACYSAKNNGRNQSYVCDEQSSTRTGGEDRIRMIKNALENNHYKLLMQPIISNSKEENFQRYELLVRLQCDNGELLEPAAFLPLAKRYALLQELDCWVVGNALNALRLSHAENRDVAMSINLSASTLTNPKALERIVAIFSSHNVPANRVCFDITETFAIRNIEAVSEFMRTLKADGVEFALDDFGNGLSSFTHLQQLPVNYLKLDGELIRKLAIDPTVRCITESFHELSRKLGIKTVAESVEDPATIACVNDIGIDYMQGFGVADLIELETLSSIDSCRNYE